MHTCYTIFGELLKLLRDINLTEPLRSVLRSIREEIYDMAAACHHAVLTDWQKDSLRDIATGLTAHAARCTILELSGVSKSTLADANNRRDYRIFESLFYNLMRGARI